MQKRMSVNLFVLLFISCSVYANESIDNKIKVVDAKGHPVAEAEVLLFEEVWNYSAGQLQLRKLEDSKKTDDKGVLEVQLPFGENHDLVIVARKEGLAMDWARIERRNLHANATLRLDTPSHLAGKVVDEKGQPILGAHVSFCLTNERLEGHPGIPFRVPEDWFCTKTDAEGRFRFDTIAADVAADFKVASPGRACVWTFQKWDSEPGRMYPAGLTDIEISMVPEARIEGTVVDTTGKGIGGIRLLARTDKGNANYYSADLIVSAPNGNFCFEGLPADTYSLQVVSPNEGMAEWVGRDTKVICETGQTVKDVVITVSKGGIIELVIRDSQSKGSLENIWFSISQEASYSRHPGFYLSTRTDDKGCARIRIPPGTCCVSAGGNGYSHLRLDPAFTIAEGEIKPFEILLDQDPRISGIVKDEAGNPVSGATVHILPVDNGVVQTDMAGKFSISWSNRYSIQRKFVFVQHLKRNLVKLLEINDLSQPLDIILEPGWTLAGKVTDTHGIAIPVARIQLGARLPDWITHVGSEAVTDAEGSYEIQAIPKAIDGVEYHINIAATGYNPLEYKTFSLIEKTNLQFEDRIFVMESANLSITGIVVDPNGDPAPGRVIFLTGTKGGSGQPRRQVVTNEKGEFFIGRIAKGPLRLQAGFPNVPGGHGRLNAEGGDQNVKIILGQEQVHMKQVSLSGKKLPEMAALHLPVDPNAMGEQAVLLCFCDMGQRPSRHGVEELVKRAEELKGKGVWAAVVQTEPVGQKALEEWKAKYQIPFPVGMIGEEGEKVLAGWGVRGQPWLILTDRGQVVRAEGFGVEKLEEKLKRVVGE